MSEPMYSLVYHSSIGFRAAPMQMLMLDAKVPFEMKEPVWAPERCLGENPGHPVFAPPVLVKGDFHIAQTVAIMNYLGDVHGYNPDSAEDRAVLLQLNLDVGDVTSELFSKARSGKEGIQEFVSTERLAKWLSHFEKVLLRKDNSAYLFGDKLSTADFMFISALEALDYVIGGKHVSDMLPAAVAAYRKGVEEHSFFVAYKAQAKPQLFESLLGLYSV